MDQIRPEVAKWNPEETERVTGVPGSQMERVARTLANHRPFAICWCMGSTQHHTGSSNTRAYCILGLAMGMLGVSGGGAHIFRGPDNVQGATDIDPLNATLPAYSGLPPGTCPPWAPRWDARPY